jgi:hypothetical protein
LSINAKRIVTLADQYTKTIEMVIDFLQDNNPTLAHLICEGNYLPEASRFDQTTDLEWAFGTMGTRDKARHLATLYLEDISDLIIEAIDPHFGFSRYAERLGRSANTFNELNTALNQPNTYIDDITLTILADHIETQKPNLVCISAPFPGNLYAAFKCGQWLKNHYPDIKIALGGGFANTELRSISETKVFNFIDFITLDDGERPLEVLLQYLEGKIEKESLKRTFMVENGIVKYFNCSKLPDYKQKDVGTPDYSNLILNKYLSVIEVANPMHRLWSDGRWNKLTLAHGCYWGKCTFCDISLDYIKIYEATTAQVLVDRIEQIINQTGQNGFHFVDEAAPPALMREVALEILRRNLTVVWWTNIRFEKSFTFDLCKLLAQSGCIAISGGLEVASDRLLDLIQKGVTVAQVAKVADNFTQAGIMVHAYLMYGFPTQTAQETVDSLEVVRQLFENGVLQSGFWHQFAMTAHAPVGLDPKAFKVKAILPLERSFANNDLVFEDPTGADHDTFSEGLKKSLFNYMHGICFEFPLQKWFDFKIPGTKISKNYIENILDESEIKELLPSSKVLWNGVLPELTFYNKSKKGVSYEMVNLTFCLKRGEFEVSISQEFGQWLYSLLPKISLSNQKLMTIQEVENDFLQAGLPDFTLFWHSKAMIKLKENGLLVL